MALQKVRVLEINGGYVYVIPNNLEEEFLDDYDDCDDIEEGEFNEKWGKFLMNEEFNNIQLWADLNEKV